MLQNDISDDDEQNCHKKVSHFSWMLHPKASQVTPDLPRMQFDLFSVGRIWLQTDFYRRLDALTEINEWMNKWGSKKKRRKETCIMKPCHPQCVLRIVWKEVKGTIEQRLGENDSVTNWMWCLWYRKCRIMALVRQEVNGTKRGEEDLTHNSDPDLNLMWSSSCFYYY